MMSRKNDRGWIPIEEWLPEDENLCLVTCHTKKGVLNVNRAYYSNGFWHGSGSMAEVIAWRPLPEPYKPDSEEEKLTGWKAKMFKTFCGGE